MHKFSLSRRQFGRQTFKIVTCSNNFILRAELGTIHCLPWFCAWRRKEEQREDEEMAKGDFLSFSQSTRKVSHNCSALSQLILHPWDTILPSKAKSIDRDGLSPLKQQHPSGFNSAPNWGGIPTLWISRDNICALSLVLGCLHCELLNCRRR